MLGWEIFIHKELSDSTDMIDWRVPKAENVLATWRTGLGGEDWLNALEEAGKAKCLGGNGYPIRYLAKVKDVLPLIESGPPVHSGPLVIGDDYVTPSGWVSEATIKLKEFQQEDPERIIVIDAWDES
jgi:hypothetical protein